MQQQNPTQCVQRLSEVACEILSAINFETKFPKKEEVISSDQRILKKAYKFNNCYAPIVQPTSRNLEQAKTGCQGETLKKGDRL